MWCTDLNQLLFFCIPPKALRASSKAICWPKSAGLGVFQSQQVAVEASQFMICWRPPLPCHNCAHICCGLGMGQPLHLYSSSFSCPELMFKLIKTAAGLTPAECTCTGGAIVGLIFGLVTRLLLKVMHRRGHQAPEQLTLTVAMAYLCFYIANAPRAASGVLHNMSVHVRVRLQTAAAKAMAWQALWGSPYMDAHARLTFMCITASCSGSCKCACRPISRICKWMV